MTVFLLALRAIGRGMARVPWQVWVAAVLVLAGWLYGEARYDAGKAACEAAVAEVSAKAEKEARKEEQRQSGASAAATQAKDDRLNEKLPAIEGRTHEATERVRVIYRDRPVPAECKRPDGVRNELEAARQRANAAGRELRGGASGADPADPRRSGAGG